MNPGLVAALPHLLLVEDDPTSAAFLAEAATAFPARVTLAGSLAEAFTASVGQTFDLLLIDAHLPDGFGHALLRQLRQRGITAPALAHTAQADAATSAPLQAAGFLDVLQKPMSVLHLHAALRQHLQQPAPSPPIWNDAGAQAAVGGNRSHVAQLRSLFLQELPGQRNRIGAATARQDVVAVRAELHRLTASCGFVGADALAQAVQALRAAPLEPAAKAALDAAIADLLMVPPATA
ncbi:MAG: response regulator [Xanthomonadaceae bacterium]|nr:response regulator [Xanthomonadaceae bacterium]